MKRAALAALALMTLACGGVVESAKQAATEQAEREIAERALEYGLGAQDVQIGADGSAVIRTADGEIRAGSGTTLPEGFPLTLGDGATLQGVTSFSDPSQRLDTVTGTLAGGRPAAKAMLADLEAQAVAAGFTVTTKQDQDLGTAMLAALLVEKGDEKMSISITGDSGEFVFALGWIRPPA